MKLSFKIYFSLLIIMFIALVSPSPARDVVVISYNNHSKKAQFIKQVLVNRIKIPKKLVSLRWKKRSCNLIKNAILQICFDEKGEMHFPVVKRSILNNSFQVFLNKKDKDRETLNE